MAIKIIFFILGSIILAAIVYFFFYKGKSGVFDTNNSPVPKEYQSYQNINASYQSDIFEIKEICKTVVSSAASPNPIRAYQSVQNNIIIDCDPRNGEDNKGDALYFKINKMGQVTDSLYVKYTRYWTVLIDDYMVHTYEDDAYFTTWPKDGDQARKDFLVINADFKMEAKELSAKVDQIKKESRYYFVRTYVKNHRYLTATYFYANNLWQVLWQETASYQSEMDAESASRYQQELYRSGTPEPYLDTAVKSQYFYQQDNIQYYHSIGGNTPATSKIDWRGIGYFETNIAGSPFHFSINNLVIEKEEHDGYKTRLYQVDEPKYAVKHINTKFYHSPFGFALYAPQAKVLYVIRKKKK